MLVRCPGCGEQFELQGVVRRAVGDTIRERLVAALEAVPEQRVAELVIAVNADGKQPEVSETLVRTMLNRFSVDKAKGVPLFQRVESGWQTVWGLAPGYEKRSGARPTRGQTPDDRIARAHTQLEAIDRAEETLRNRAGGELTEAELDRLDLLRAPWIKLLEDATTPDTSTEHQATSASS